MLEFGAALPRLREVIRRHLGERGLVRERVLAAAVRLIDLGYFRPGGEEYAAENGSFGLATIRRDQVAVSGRQIVFTYTGKAAKHQEQAVAEEQVCAVVRSLRRRRGGGRLLAYRSGRRWHDVTAADINDYLREVSGGEFTAKDFRTWHAPCWRPSAEPCLRVPSRWPRGGGAGLLYRSPGHQPDRHASRPPAAVAVISGAGVWIVVSIAAGFPARSETISRLWWPL